MSDDLTPRTVDELLDAYIAAWHAGEAPSLAAYVARAAPADRDELEDLIATFLEIAPTVEPTTARGIELVQDPLVHRVALLEDAWWDRQAAATVDAGVDATADAAAGVAADPATGGEAASNDPAVAPWGERLRVLRESAGLSLSSLGASFAAHFGLSGEAATAAPAVLERLEQGALPATGVAARAARALEELLGAARGALGPGAAPAFGGALFRGALPEDAGERQRFADLLREVDDALPPADEGDDDQGGGESLRGLLGA